MKPKELCLACKTFAFQCEEKRAAELIFDNSEFKMSQKELKEVNKELKAFSYSVSHDLRACEIINSTEKCQLEKERNNLKIETETKVQGAHKYAEDLSNKLLLATKTAGIGIWEYLIHENKFIADDVLLSLYGITSAEFIGSFESWMQYVHPDDKKRINGEFKNALVSHANFDTEFRNVWPDGTVHFIKGNAVVQKDCSGKPTRLIGTNQDITKSKEAERVLRESEYRLSEAQAVAKVGSWETDLSTFKVIWSLETYRIFEIPPKESNATHQNFLWFVHPEDRAKVDAAFAASFCSNHLNTIEHRIVTPAGSIKTVEERWRIIADDEGKPLYARGTIQDITERKQSEQLMIESEAKYRSFFESSIDGILLTVTNGEIISANPAACEIFKMTEAEICAAGRVGLADNTDPRLHQLLHQRQQTGMAKGELTLVRKDGSKFQGELSSAVFKDAYGQERTSAIVRDITDRKAAEEKVIATSNALQLSLNDLNNIMDSSLDIICTIDEEGRFVKVSAASKKIWGYTPDELQGKLFMDIVYPEDAELTSKTDNNIENGVPVSVFENRYVHKNGTVVPMMWSARYNENDNLIHCIAKDATNKKRLEKAFENERQQFHDLFMQAPTSMGILKGPDHVFEVANPPYLQLIGKENIIGKPLKQVIPEVRDQGIITLLDGVYETGKTFLAREMLIKLDKDGTGKLIDHYLNFIYQAYRNTEGIIEGIFFFAVDVSEQVLSRKKVEESEKQYRQIVETAQEGIWVIDENNKTIFVNKKMTEIMGYSNDEMIGRTNLSFKDEAGKQMTLKQIERRKTGIMETHDASFITKNGELILTHISTNPIFDEQGIYRGALAMVTDITQRKAIEDKLAHSESSLQEAQAIAHIGNWEIDLASNTLLWSDELYKIFGVNKENITPSTELYFSLIHPDDVNFVREEKLKSAKTFTSSSYEYRLKTRDGLVKYCYTQSRFELDKNNKPLRLFGVVQDITQRKLTEIERTKMVSDLIQRNKELEQFNYIVSHNLRAPIANILGFAEALADKEYPESLRQQFLSHLSVSVSKLDDVTRDLNNILLIKQKVNDVKETVSLSMIIKNIEISIQNLAEQYNVNIQTDFSEVESILSIKSFVHSIIYNLISNSIKYRLPGKAPVILIRTHKTREGIELLFSDNGLGIDLKKNHDKVFGLYKRFHLHIEGKGIGLFMTKSLIETLGGTIAVSSEINKGTTFKIHLPF